MNLKISLIGTAFLAAATACSTEEAVDWCDTDRDCEAKAVQGAIPSTHKICQPNAHVCYKGCSTDAQCRDVAAFSDKMVCDPADGRCKLKEEFLADTGTDGPGVDGDMGVDQGGDAGSDNGPDANPDIGDDLPVPDMPLLLGDRCDGANQCQSGKCTDGVCCAVADCGPCKRCNLNGNGTCSAIQDGPSVEDCGGGACAGECSSGACIWPKANTECATSCDSVDKGFHYKHRCATDKASCDVTTEKVTCGVCERCGAGVGDACAAYTGAPSSTECGGTGACQGTCVSGLCKYAAVPNGLVVRSDCVTAAPDDIEEIKCDGKGNAQATATRSCAPYSCDDGVGSNDTCFAGGCQASHSKCAAAAACDRSNAHTTGAGVCVDAIAVANAAGLTSQLSQTWTGTRVFRLAAGSYDDLSINGKDVKLIAGASGVQIVSPSGGTTPAVTVSGATVMLQGVKVVGGGGGSTANGITCSGNGSALVVIESLIDGNAGLGISSSGGCDVTVRRSTLNRNAQGGMQLQSGTFAVTNTLIVGNGTTVSLVGGVSITTSSATFANNTVYSNLAAGGTPAGVSCSSSAIVVQNSIVTANSGDQVNLCTVTNSNTAPNATGTSPENSCEMTVTPVGGIPIPEPTAARCLNTSGTTSLELDHDSAPRVSGGGVDLGAFEQ
jgi:hypothetical protein